MIILIGAAQCLFCDGLSLILRQWHKNAEILRAVNFTDVITILNQRNDIALVIVEDMLPGMNGHVGLETILKQVGVGRVVFVSDNNSPEHIRRVMNIGAAAVVPRTLNSHAFITALQLVVAGGTYLPAGFLSQDDTNIGRVDFAPPSSLTLMCSPLHLTPRQLDVLEWLVRGATNKAIARSLGITEGTVKLHVTNVLRRLDAKNRTEAANKARQLYVLNGRESILR
jgi:DNA-binding NarL/FixJ family response regulator